MSPSTRSTRRRSSHSSRAHSIYDAVCIILLILVPTIAVIIFGGSRLWSFGPLMALTFLATTLVALRPVWFPSLRHKHHRPPAWSTLCLFACFAFVMVPSAAVPFDGIVECLMLASYLAAYWSWTKLAGFGRKWEFFATLMILLGTLVSWYAIIQHVRGSHYVLTLPRLGPTPDKASGTFISPNHFADLLAMLTVMSISMVFCRKLRLATRLLAGYGILVCVPTLFLTQSRSGWIGLAAGVLVFGLVISLRRSRKQFLIASILLPMFLATVSVGLWTFSPNFQDRFKRAFTQKNVRLFMWEDSLNLIKDKPVKGYGPGSYRWIYPLYKKAYKDPDLFPRFAHNEIIHLVAELGLLGLLLVALAVGILVRRLLLLACRSAREDLAYASAGVLATLAASTAHAMFDYTWHVFSNMHVLALLGGVVAAKTHTSDSNRDWPRFQLPWYLRSSVAALSCILLLGFTAIVTASYLFAFFSGKSREHLDYSQALELCERSEQIYPYYYNTYVERGKALYSQGVWNLDPAVKKSKATEAIRAYDRALELNQYDLFARHGRSQSLDLSGDPEGALSELRELLKLAPTHYYYLKEFGLTLRHQGKYEEALDIFDKARKIKRRDDMVIQNQRFLRRKLKQKRQAERKKAAD